MEQKRKTVPVYSKCLRLARKSQTVGSLLGWRVVPVRSRPNPAAQPSFSCTIYIALLGCVDFPCTVLTCFDGLAAVREGEVI